MIRKIEIPTRLSGASVKKTRLGWKAKCKRCGSWIKFDRHAIETTGDGSRPSAYALVASGYTYAKENSDLAKDFEERRLDWVDFVTRKRKLEYIMAKMPFTAFTMTSVVKLVCPDCANTTSVRVDFGDEVELKKLPSTVKALVMLGIGKENTQFFQLRTGKLAKNFVKLMRDTRKEIRLLEETPAKVKQLIDSLPSPSATVAEVLQDVKTTAKASADTQILNLKKWMTNTVSAMEDKLFPNVEGGGVKEPIAPQGITAGLHGEGPSVQEIERQRLIQRQRR